MATGSSKKTKDVPRCHTCHWYGPTSCFTACYCIVYDPKNDPKKYLKSKYRETLEKLDINKPPNPEVEYDKDGTPFWYISSWSINFHAPVDEDIVAEYKKRGLMSTLGFMV